MYILVARSVHGSVTSERVIADVCLCEVAFLVFIFRLHGSTNHIRMLNCEDTYRHSRIFRLHIKSQANQNIPSALLSLLSSVFFFFSLRFFSSLQLFVFSVFPFQCAPLSLCLCGPLYRLLSLLRLLQRIFRHSRLKSNCYFCVLVNAHCCCLARCIHFCLFNFAVLLLLLRI